MRKGSISWRRSGRGGRGLRKSKRAGSGEKLRKSRRGCGPRGLRAEEAGSGSGDQSGKGYSGFTYRPVTLEGNFAAAQAVHEMLLQSWGGKVRVFPSVPSAWQDVSFSDLRAEGGFTISAERRAGKTVRVTVTALHGGELRLKCDTTLTWTTPAGPQSGDHLDVALKPGQQIVGSSFQFLVASG